MVHGNNPRVFCSPGEEDVAAGSPNQQYARRWLVTPRRRKRVQPTSERQGRGQSRPLQVYKFTSRAPSTSVHCNGEVSLGLSRIPASMEDGKIVEMLVRSASYRVQQEPARCWVRDCTGLACSAAGHHPRRHLSNHHLLGEKDGLTSLIKEEFLSMDEGNHGSIGNSGAASSWVDVTSDDGPKGFAEEYSLVPLNTWKKYSAQSFDQQVENYLKQL